MRIYVETMGRIQISWFSHLRHNSHISGQIAAILSMFKMSDSIRTQPKICITDPFVERESRCRLCLNFQRSTLLLHSSSQFAQAEALFCSTTISIFVVLKNKTQPNGTICVRWNFSQCEVIFTESFLMWNKYSIFFKSKGCVGWSKLERLNREKVPACLKSLLLASGFNTLLSLSNINIEIIREVETYINKNRCHLDKLNCCFAKEYREQTHFEFLPGHKNILLNIPEQIVQLKHGQNNKSRAKPSSSQPNAKTFTESEVKSRLVTNLLTFTVKNGFPSSDAAISELNIRDFRCCAEEEDSIYKCKFSCPFCPKVFPIRFKTYWTSSNVTTHLKKHINISE